MWKTVAFAFVVLSSFAGCDGESASSSMEMGMNSSEDMGMNRVPFDGEITPSNMDAEIDERSYFPLFIGAQWRYRHQTADWESPPAVTEGAESIVVAGAEENEFVRRTVAIIDLMVDDMPQTVRQTMEETYVVTPENMRKGPIVSFKRFVLEERAIESDTVLRRVERTYFPAYTLFSDTWKTGIFDTRMSSNDTYLTEIVTEAGEDEPREIRGRINLEVLTSDQAQVLQMEGRYREQVRQVDVADHFAGTITRTYWVQQGVGIVQWQYPDTNNIVHTLMESNVERPAGD